MLLRDAISLSNEIFQLALGTIFYLIFGTVVINFFKLLARSLLVLLLNPLGLHLSLALQLGRINFKLVVYTPKSCNQITMKCPVLKRGAIVSLTGLFKIFVGDISQDLEHGL